ncbi:MAG: hypothetical protein IJ702_06985 [Fretibacterium sp.]|nr:hypothetical protein [Fretibacterium sp.]
MEELDLGKQFVRSKSNQRMLNSILNLFPLPVTVVCETGYVDKVYRDLYYTYFASKHLPYSKDCWRLSFFCGELGVEDFYTYSEANEKCLQESFAGICVLRPLAIGMVGRTLLDPDKLKIQSASIRTTKFSFIILGHELVVRAFPFSSQDAEVMTCSQTTVFNILEYFSVRYPEYRAVLPSQMMSEVEHRSTERVLPSTGLHYLTMSALLKTFGFSPRVYTREAFTSKDETDKAKIPEKFKRIFHYYVESGIPLAVGVDIAELSCGHAINCIGHGQPKEDISGVKTCPIGQYQYINAADLYDDYVVMDDNCYPYKIEGFDEIAPQYKTRSEVFMFAVPLYKRIFLEATDAAAILERIFQMEEFSFAKVVPEVIKKTGEPVDVKNPLVLKIFLTSSRKYRKFRASKESDIHASAFYATLRLPKFIWVAEISTYCAYRRNEVFGEIVIDATSRRREQILDSLILIRYLNFVGFRASAETNVDLNKMQKADVMKYPYCMYQNNLDEFGGKCDEHDFPA